MLKFLKKISSKWLLFLATIASLACFFAFDSLAKKESVSAMAETKQATVYYDGFEMKKGASIRIAEGNGGIRFITNVSAAAYANINAAYPENKGITFYTLIARADKVQDQNIENLTADFAATSEFAVKGKATNQPDGSSDQYYQTALIVENAINNDKLLMARGMAQIVDKDGNVQYVYAKSNENIRTMKQVAVSAIEDEKTTTDKGFSKYFTAKEGTVKSAVEVSDCSQATVKMPTLAEGENVIGVFQNGQRVNYSYANGALTITDTETAFAAIEIGANLSYTVYTSANNTYSATVVKATKILTNCEDLAVFDINETDKKVEGYYVLGADIDATDWSGNTHAYVTMSSNDCTKTGFFGTLDGFGHTIEMNVSGYGLFGNFFGTLQNVSFVFHETADYAYSYPLGCWAGLRWSSRVAFYNVNVTVDNFGAASKSNNGDNSTLLARNSGGWLKMENCTFEAQGVKEATTAKTTGILVEKAEYYPTAEKLAIFGQGGSDFTYAFVDVTVKTNVKKAPIMTMQNGCSYWAKNDGKTAKLDDTSDWLIVLGEYKSDYDNIDCDGVVRADLDEKLEYVSIDEFSAYDGTIDWSFIGDEEIISVKQGATVLTADKANGTLKGVVPNITAGSYTGSAVFSDGNVNPEARTVSPVNVTVETSGGVYYLEIMAYTRVITTVDQLSMFDLSNTDNDFLKTGTDNARTIEGYFLLGADLTSDRFVNTHECIDKGSTASQDIHKAFRGVFDGNGHTISVPMSDKGLFGSIIRGYIKNVNFVFTETSTSGSVGLAYWMSAEKWSQRNAMSDVTITVNDFGASNTNGNKSAAIAFCFRTTNNSFTNVTVNVNYAEGVATNKTTGILGIARASTSNDISVTVVESVATAIPLLTNINIVSMDLTNLRETSWASNDGKTADTTNFVLASAVRQVKAE